MARIRLENARKSAIANNIEVVIGDFPPMRVGQGFLFRGHWVVDKQWGPQLKATSFEEQELTQEVDLVAYLRAGGH